MQYDIKYHVDEKNKVVVATADFYSELDKLFNKKFEQAGFCGQFHNYFPASFTDFYKPKDFYRVVARCHDDDVFDAEVGKKICRQKLKAKFYKIFNKIAVDYKNYLHKNLICVNNYIKNIH